MRHLAKTLLLAALGAGCAQPETPPPRTPAPAARPTAPPAATEHLPTAIDLLVSHQAELQLRPEQLEHIKAVGKQLDQANAPLEQQLAALGPVASSNTEQASTPPPRGRGGAGMGRMGGGMGRRGGRGMGGGRGAPAQSPSHSAPAQHDTTDKAGPLHKQMAENHEAAVAEAFALLDDDQQQRAAKLLEANDYDPPSIESVQARPAHADSPPARPAAPDHAAP